jgi:type VI protein secretion system component VasF
LLSSSNPNVASVSTDGVVQGLSAGTAKITARSGGRVAEATVVVRAAQRRTIHTSQPSTVSAVRTRAPEPVSVLSSSRGAEQGVGVNAISRAFRRHLTLAARLQAGASLTSSSQEPATADQLQTLLADAEQRSGFLGAQQSVDPADFEGAQYAVNAFIDQEARARFKDAWKPRNPDPHVATSFYRRLLNRRKAVRSAQARDEVAEIYALCVLLGFRGDPTLHESVEVRSALREVVRRSGDATTVLQSQELTPLGYDARILRAHRFARLALFGLLIVTLASLLLRAVLQ